MSYALRFHPVVKAWYKGLPDEDKAALKVLFNAIAACPQLGDPVKTEDGLRYQKTYWVNKERWPNGIRVVYSYDCHEIVVYVMNAGDHKTCARFVGQSVYADERR